MVGWPEYVTDLLGDLLTTAYPSLTRALAEALADALWFIEGTEDEQMHPDDAVTVLENAARLLGLLSEDQRAELTSLLEEMARAEADPARREFLDGFAEGFGLLDDED
ncbi:hypothetical protein [Streptomyces sp. NPDC029003]|uniref:hypothetical protein n=1 Tax=Streptomyces sp. NPDC029003 TaxID=3155125 RepID=UPI0033E438C9